MEDIKFTKEEVISLIINLKILKELNRGKKLYKELSEQIEMLENGDYWAFMEKNVVRDLFPLKKEDYHRYLLFLQYWDGVIDKLRANNIHKYDLNIHLYYNESQLSGFIQSHLKEMNNKIDTINSNGAFGFEKYLEFLDASMQKNGKAKYDIKFITDYLEKNEFPIIE